MMKPVQQLIYRTRRRQVHRRRTANKVTPPVQVREPSQSPPPSIMFLISDAGGGHRSAANAIIQSLEKQYPGKHQYELVEVASTLGLAGKGMGIVLNWAYNTAIQTGNYWLEPPLYHLMTTLRTILFPLGCYYMGNFLAKKQPDLLITLIHGCHTALYKGMEQQDLDIPSLIVVTDPISLRASWSHPKANCVMVATEMAKESCIKNGTPSEKIRVFGHPIDPRFAEPEETESELRRRYFLSKDLFTIMLIMGGTGNNNIYYFSKALSEMGLPIQIVACCGSDKRLQTRMEHFAKNAPIPIKVFGFTREIHNLMTLSNLVITKPGPGTIMEALAKDLPLIIDCTKYTMWQEKGNVDYVRDNNLGRVIRNSSELKQAVQELMENPREYDRIRTNIQEHKNPHATAKIVDVIIETLQ